MASKWQLWIDSGSDMPDILGKLHSFLHSQGLETINPLMMKIATTDMSSKDAYVFCFYNKDEGSSKYQVPRPGSQQLGWEEVSYSTGYGSRGYYKLVAEKILKLMNGTLTEPQALCSQICAVDEDDGDFSMAIVYPNKLRHTITVTR